MNETDATDGNWIENSYERYYSPPPSRYALPAERGPYSYDASYPQDPYYPPRQPYMSLLPDVQTTGREQLVSPEYRRPTVNIEAPPTVNMAAPSLPQNYPAASSVPLLPPPPQIQRARPGQSTGYLSDAVVHHSPNDGSPYLASPADSRWNPHNRDIRHERHARRQRAQADYETEASEQREVDSGRRKRKAQTETETEANRQHADAPERRRQYREGQRARDSNYMQSRTNRTHSTEHRRNGPSRGEIFFIEDEDASPSEISDRKYLKNKRTERELRERESAERLRQARLGLLGSKKTETMERWAEEVAGEVAKENAGR